LTRAIETLSSFGQDSVGNSHERGGSCDGVARVTARHRAIAREEKFVCGIAGNRVTEFAQKCSERIDIPLAMCGDHASNRVVGLGELGGRVDEGASAESRSIDVVHDRGDEAAQGRSRIRGRRDEALDIGAHPLMAKVMYSTIRLSLAR